MHEEPTEHEVERPNHEATQFVFSTPHEKHESYLQQLILICNATLRGIHYRLCLRRTSKLRSNTRELSHFCEFIFVFEN